jgi:4,5-DOPA dioxygenase extradiol
VGFADRLETIHDYWGFPPELYSIEYPATGCKEAAAEVLSRLRAAGFPAVAEYARGLDHGAWIPLRLMFPDADVPVVPLSIQAHLDPAHHLAVGRALAPLAPQGFLVLASGNLTHNLRDFQLAHRGGGQVPDYVRRFADWIWGRLEAGDLSSLLDYRRRAPDAERAHPRDEHLLPLYVAMGAAGAGARVERIHAGVDDHVLAMDAFAFRPGARP